MQTVPIPKQIIESALPTQKEIERIQLFTMTAYNIYDGTENSISWFMQQILGIFTHFLNRALC
jgi:hypothetical protein